MLLLRSSIQVEGYYFSGGGRKPFIRDDRGGDTTDQQVVLLSGYAFMFNLLLKLLHPIYRPGCTKAVTIAGLFTTADRLRSLIQGLYSWQRSAGKEERLDGASVRHHRHVAGSAARKKAGR